MIMSLNALGTVINFEIEKSRFGEIEKWKFVELENYKISAD